MRWVYRALGYYGLARAILRGPFALLRLLLARPLHRAIRRAL